MCRTVPGRSPCRLRAERLAGALYSGNLRRAGHYATRQLAMLEENGFVLRRRSESDRRAVEVYPTQKAEETLSAVRAVYRSWREKLFYDLTSEERDRLESLLERLARRAEDIQ